MKEGEKDAIHIPVIGYRTDKKMLPGTLVEVSDGVFGIVDPWMNRIIESDEVVMVMLQKDSVENVRHSWDFVQQSTEVQQSTKFTLNDWDDYLSDVANTLNLNTYALNRAIEHIKEYGTNVGGTQPGDYNCSAMNESDWKDFWKKYNESHNDSIRYNEDPFCC